MSRGVRWCSSARWRTAADMSAGPAGLFRQSREAPNAAEGAQRPLWVGVVLTSPPAVDRGAAGSDNALLSGSQSASSGFRSQSQASSSFEQ
jgi:hypothetical protein